MNKKDIQDELHSFKECDDYLKILFVSGYNVPIGEYINLLENYLKMMEFVEEIAHRSPSDNVTCGDYFISQDARKVLKEVAGE
jgi:hypothetical protein